VLVRTTPLPAYALKSANGALLLSTTSTAAYWEGLELRLARAPQVIDGQPHVHTLDLQRTIRPLLNGGFLEALPGQPVIVIDPGHGGEDVGTKSVLGNRYEKEFTLDWGRRLAALLGARGWRVYLTRTNDATVAISNRVAFADSRNASLFVSLHFNSAAPDVVQEGLETYCLTPVGMPSTLTRGYAEDPGAAFPNNSFDAQNLQFALRVHRALLEVNGRRDRGVRRARFLGVLRGQQRPAILVEGGYLSNLREARLIATPEYRQRLAEAVAGALMGPREGKGLEPVAALAEPAKPRETPSQKTVGANSKPAPDRAVSAGARTSSLP
jgi:N-acetylmuramoyl-L-alanine amidase